MRTGARITAAIAATIVAVPAATAASPTVVAPACSASQLSAVYTLDPFSQGAGQVGYTLTVKNRSGAACSMMTPLPVVLLDNSGKALPTNASTSAGGAYVLTLAGGQWAQAASSFSPDVPGAGEGSPCEATAHKLRIRIGGNAYILAPMDPTRVCQHGQIAFNHLSPVAIAPACTSAHLRATFNHLGDNSATGSYYGLVLRNTGTRPCYLDGAPSLRLLGRTGVGRPTREVTSVPYPIVVGSHLRVSLLASLFSVSRPGPGEPRHGPCEPKATKLRIDPRPGGGLLSTAMKPPTTVCHNGLMTVTGFLYGNPFH